MEVRRSFPPWADARAYVEHLVAPSASLGCWTVTCCAAWVQGAGRTPLAVARSLNQESQYQTAGALRCTAPQTAWDPVLLITPVTAHGKRAVWAADETARPRNSTRCASWHTNVGKASYPLQVRSGTIFPRIALWPPTMSASLSPAAPRVIPYCPSCEEPFSTQTDARPHRLPCNHVVCAACATAMGNVAKPVCTVCKEDISKGAVADDVLARFAEEVAASLGVSVSVGDVGEAPAAKKRAVDSSSDVQSGWNDITDDYFYCATCEEDIGHRWSDPSLSHGGHRVFVLPPGLRSTYACADEHFITGMTKMQASYRAKSAHCAQAVAHLQRARSRVLERSTAAMVDFDKDVERLKATIDVHVAAAKEKAVTAVKAAVKQFDAEIDELTVAAAQLACGADLCAAALAKSLLNPFKLRDAYQCARKMGKHGCATFLGPRVDTTPTLALAPSVFEVVREMCATVSCHDVSDPVLPPLAPQRGRDAEITIPFHGYQWLAPEDVFVTFTREDGTPLPSVRVERGEVDLSVTSARVTVSMYNTLRIGGSIKIGYCPAAALADMHAFLMHVHIGSSKHPVPGSPFHLKVCCPSVALVTGDCAAWWQWCGLQCCGCARHTT